MARTSITPTALSPTAETAPVSTTIDATLVTNGISVAAGGLGALVIRVANTNGSDRVITVKAGDDPPAHQAPIGDLAVTVAATSGVELIGPLETARFLQDDGTIHIDLAASFAGSIEIYSFPKGYGY
jgi:hypothetical protein